MDFFLPTPAESLAQPMGTLLQHPSPSMGTSWWGAERGWEQSSTALHYWSCRAARKSRVGELVVPREWQSSLAVGCENTQRNHRL